MPFPINPPPYIHRDTIHPLKTMLFTSLRNPNAQIFNREKMAVPLPLLQNSNVPFAQ